MALAIGCMVFYGATDGVLPFLIKEVLDGIFAERNTNLLAILPLVLICFAVLRAGFDFTQQFLTSRVGHFIVRDIRSDLNSKLLRLPVQVFLRRSAGDFITRLTSDTILVRSVLTDSFASVLRDSIRVVALLIAAFVLDWSLALIAFVVFPIAIIPVARFGKRIRKLTKRGQDSIGALGGRVHETMAGNRIVKIFGRETHEEELFRERNETLTKTFVASERSRAMVGPVNEILASLGVAAVIAWGGYSVVEGIRTQGEFIGFLVAVFLMYDPMKKLSKVHTNIQQGLSGADRIFELLDEEDESSYLESKPSQHARTPQTFDVEFDNVGFVYPGKEVSAVRNVSFHVRPGEQLALVGFSGSGKTTLAELIPLFLRPTSGVIRIGGIDTTGLNLTSLRSYISLVSQHTFLFNDTVRNNIRYGNLNASDEEIEQIAARAYATEFIQALPSGFDTVIGEGGFSLSGGERQRLAIARAMLKDAPILILDEATAALDNRSESEVQKALEALQVGRTTVVIAHRLSTIRRAHSILVMQHGEVVESGSHDELLAKGGYFLELYNLQFQNGAAEQVQASS
jgi:subfamily B ATP-binding cassette protein MsbA